MSPDQYLTREEIAVLLGTPEQPAKDDAVRSFLSRAGLRSTAAYAADSVYAAIGRRPGQGARTDIRRCIECGGAGPTDDLCDNCASSVAEVVD